MKKIFYKYKFDFNDGEHKEFLVDFDSRSLKSKLPDGSQYPDWSQLEFNQCSHCPLTSDDYLYCPLAVNLVPIIYWSKDFKSYDEVEVTIISTEREVRAHTSLQHAISSLLGLLMSSSACPKMKFLRPLARFHLPLATHEETIFRTVSSTLLRNYLRDKDNKTIEAALADLKNQYWELQEVNQFIAKRIRVAIKKDAAVNAIVLLDALSKIVSYSIDDSLQQIQYLFNDETDVA
ncbi:MAG: hypothetical protein OEY78_09870 [Gammaproteobacteria bacterium]|nr:hypothetical protein [Gammaproteobacteria bacterium]